MRDYHFYSKFIKTPYFPNYQCGSIGILNDLVKIYTLIQDSLDQIFIICYDDSTLMKNIKTNFYSTQAKLVCACLKQILYIH